MKSQNDFSVEKKIQISTSPSELISISSDFFKTPQSLSGIKKKNYIQLSLLRFSDFDYLVYNYNFLTGCTFLWFANHG